MNNGEITLVSAIFGMGNNNHVHVHRNNVLNITPNDVTTLMIEQHNGGVLPGSLNTISQRSGSLSTANYGNVNIEDGWNLRRGIGMLRFIVNGQNAIQQTELSVLGYLAGGMASSEGIDPSTTFVPVRSWTVDTTNVADMNGMPTTRSIISSSQQFLMGDPLFQKQLSSLRPKDVVEEVLGVSAIMADSDVTSEQAMKMFGGTIGNDLSTGVIISKTNNLNPANHARALLGVAAKTCSDHATINGITDTIADNLNTVSLGESSPFESPFFAVMQTTIGMASLNGFNGFSIGEIATVFSNFSEVLNLNLLNQSNFSGVDNTLDSSEYGSGGFHELIGSELAYLTLHTLIQCGLTGYSFSATNNVSDTGGIVSETGVAFVDGEAMSVLNQDPYLINRVASFKERIINDFFAKYNGVFDYQRTTISVEVQSYLFGETAVTIHFDDKVTQARRYVNATYAINRHSTNIAASEVARAQTKGLFTNIYEHFNNVSN